MKPFTTSILAALAGAVLVAGCAVTPVAGPYGYGYDRYDYYNRPYYHDYGYYDTWPGYYYGGPAVYGSFRFGARDHDRHWDGGSWRHDSLTSQGDQSRSRALRSPRSSMGSSHASTRARVTRHVPRHDSDKS
jgi:hypothetical protein